MRTFRNIKCELSSKSTNVESKEKQIQDKTPTKTDNGHKLTMLQKLKDNQHSAVFTQNSQFKIALTRLTGSAVLCKNSNWGK